MRQRTNKPQVNIAWENIETLADKKFEKGGGVEFRVGRWVVDGKKMAINIERREYYDNEGGKTFTKAKGFNYDDAKYIADNWDVIECLMKGITIKKATDGEEKMSDAPILSDF